MCLHLMIRIFRKESTNSDPCKNDRKKVFGPSSFLMLSFMEKMQLLCYNKTKRLETGEVLCLFI